MRNQTHEQLRIIIQQVMAKCPISRLFIYLFIKRREYECMLENNSQFRAFLHTQKKLKSKFKMQGVGILARFTLNSFY